MQHRCASSIDITEWHRSCQRSDKRFQIIMVLATGKIFRYHRAMKGRPAITLIERDKQRRNIAIAHHDLGPASDRLLIELREQMHRTIAAARGKDRLYLWI